MASKTLTSKGDDAAASGVMDQRRRLLEGAILPTMVRLALPTILILAFQVLVGVAEVYFLSFLGTAALAGVSLAFPCITLMQMASGGGFGAGVSSAVARAVGAGREQDAEALVRNAIVLALALGLITTTAEALGARPLFRAMGGSGAALQTASAYADVVMGVGAVLIWVVNLLTAALRGAGDTASAAVVTLLGGLVALPLSPLLIFGLGPVPAFGVVGAGMALLAYYAAALAFLLAHFRSLRCPLRLRLNAPWLDRRLIGDVLAVGGLAALGAATPNLSIGLATAAVGAFGVDAIAGYGLAMRLDFAMTPLLFGLGVGVMVFVGANVGAGRWRRAERAMWLGVLLGAGCAELIGLVVAMFPNLWLGLFTRNPAALAVGASCFRCVGPLYGVNAATMLVSFAAQGAGRALRPLIARVLQLLVGSVGGLIGVIWFRVDVGGLFLIVALGIVVAFPVVATALHRPTRCVKVA